MIKNPSRFMDAEGALRAAVAIVAFAFIYYFFIAADVFVAESKALIKKTESFSAPGPAGLGSLLGTAASPYETLMLKDFIYSLDMLERIEKRFDLKKEYHRRGLDVLGDLSPNVGQEQIFKYYMSRVRMSFDELTGLMTLTTEGFSPEFAANLNKAILEESEAFMNELFQKSARDQLDFANEQLQRTRELLDESKRKLLAFQDTYGLLDPVEQAKTRSKMIETMRAKRVELETKLRSMQAYLTGESAQIIGLTNAIRSIDAQIEKETARVASTEESEKLNEIAAEFLELKSLVEFNADLYKAALSAYEKTRLEAVRKVKELAVIATPHAPSAPEPGRRFRRFATLALVIALLFGLVSLASVIIEDHKE